MSILIYAAATLDVWWEERNEIFLWCGREKKSRDIEEISELKWYV